MVQPNAFTMQLPHDAGYSRGESALSNFLQVLGWADRAGMLWATQGGPSRKGNRMQFYHYALGWRLWWMAGWLKRLASGARLLCTKLCRRGWLGCAHGLDPMRRPCSDGAHVPRNGRGGRPWRVRARHLLWSAVRGAGPAGRGRGSP